MKDLHVKESEPSLYGITHSNRNFKDKYFWGKNQFNSSFPVALCCYMRDKNYGCVLISQDKTKTKVSEVGFDEIFGTHLPNERLKFCFESAYAPYATYVEDEMEIIDLVIKENDTDKFIRPLEIKLTTLPDSETSELSEDKFGSEIVVRSPTMRYMALGLAERCLEADRMKIKSIFDNSCKGIRDWGNQAEMQLRKGAIFLAMNKFLIEFEKRQKPLVLQPIWKTDGMEPRLAENCLDVFAWSDFALARSILVDAQSRLSDEITSSQGMLFQLARFLYEFSLEGRVFQHPIFDGMQYDEDDDLSTGMTLRLDPQFRMCTRYKRPIIRKRELKNIVLGGAESLLRPSYGFVDLLCIDKTLFTD